MFLNQTEVMLEFRKTCGWCGTLYSKSGLKNQDKESLIYLNNYQWCAL